MSEEHVPKRDETGDDRKGAGEPGEERGMDLPAATVGSKLDPDFIPAESHENPDEERARKHPEETGS
ncbi:hypothetical protein [Arthrobacter sp. NA-172]|uniref:hypothetical protein n=1 Tax=Arthrobacter sp. NA-172 TaxID=3367524 RepID=UPI0037549619